MLALRRVSGAAGHLQGCGESLGKVVAATYCDRDSQASPRLAVLSMAQLAKEAGARLVTGAKVIDLRLSVTRGWG